MNPLSFYKPNKSNSGHAASFSSVNGNLFCSMIKQFSWDDQKRTGSFIGNKEDPSKNVSTKLSAAEAGSILNVIKNCTKFSTFHSSKDQTLNISFQPWINPGGELAGFGFLIDKKSKTDSTAGNKFNLTLTLGEAEVLGLFFQEYIKSTFMSSGEQTQERPQRSGAPKKQYENPSSKPSAASGYSGGYRSYAKNKVENLVDDPNIGEDSGQGYEAGTSNEDDEW